MARRPGTIASMAQGDPRQRAVEGFAGSISPLFQTREEVVEVARRRKEAEPTTQVEREAWRPFIMQGLRKVEPTWKDKDLELATNTILSQSTRRDMETWAKTVQFMQRNRALDIDQTRVSIAGRPRPVKGPEPFDFNQAFAEQERGLAARFRTEKKVVSAPGVRSLAMSEVAKANPRQLPGVSAFDRFITVGNMSPEETANFIRKTVADPEARAFFAGLDDFADEYISGLETMIVQPERTDIPFVPDFLINFFREVPAETVDVPGSRGRPNVPTALKPGEGEMTAGVRG